MQVVGRLLRNRVAALSGVALIILTLLAIFAPFVAPQDPKEVDLERKLLPGFWDHRGVPGFLLGTDELGRDVLSRVIYGGRYSLLAGCTSALAAGTLGLLLGSVILFSDRIDNLIMRFMDVIFAFPALLLAIAVVSALGPGLTNAVIAIGIVDTPRMARVVRGEMLRLRGAEYMEAARAVGAGSLRLLFRHALPNILPLAIVYSGLQVGRAILTVAGLSFLGLGARPPAPEWGAMLADSRDVMMVGAWWVVTSPGAAIVISVLGFNLLGDGLRDTLDPRLR
jgi:ABC-type dipeptide/oligopeptide/nickel transport system permease subunit